MPMTSLFKNFDVSESFSDSHRSLFGTSLQELMKRPGIMIIKPVKINCWTAWQESKKASEETESRLRKTQRRPAPR